MTQSGSIFVQIGDENVHLLRSLMDEVFGSDNFISLIAYDTTGGQTAEFLAASGDYLLWYAKERASTKFHRLFAEKMAGVGASTGERYDQQSADGRAYQLTSLTSQSIGREKGEGAACWFPVQFDGRMFRPSAQVRWKTNETGMQKLLSAGRIAKAGETLRYVRYLEDFPAYPITNSWHDTAGGAR